MSGSIASAWVNGITYFPKADADFSYEGDRDVEGIKHSGGTLKKVTLKAATVSGIDLVCPESADIVNLRAANKKQGKYGIGFKEQDGTIWNSTGFIVWDSYTTAEKTVSLSMVPDKDWEITLP